MNSIAAFFFAVLAGLVVVQTIRASYWKHESNFWHKCYLSSQKKFYERIKESFGEVYDRP